MVFLVYISVSNDIRFAMGTHEKCMNTDLKIESFRREKKGKVVSEAEKPERKREAAYHKNRQAMATEIRNRKTWESSNKKLFKDKQKYCNKYPERRGIAPVVPLTMIYTFRLFLKKFTKFQTSAINVY